MTNNPSQVEPVEGLAEDEVEALAHVLWLHEAKRAAPNVAKYRTLEAFRNDLNAKDRAVWLDQAAAALSYLSPRITQQAEEVARLREALAEQVAECFDERCEMCARHESLLNEQPGGVRQKDQN